MRIAKPSFRLKNSDRVCFSRSGRFLSQKGLSGTKITIWDVQLRQLLAQHKLIVDDHHIGISPNEEVMVTKNLNGELVFFELVTGKVISSTGKFKYNHQGCQPQFSLDNSSLIDGDNSGNLVVWDCHTAKRIYCKQFNNHMITDIRYCAIKNRFYVVVNPYVVEKSGTKLL